MKLLIMLMLSFAGGYMARAALQDAIDRIIDWRVNAIWAGAAVAEVITIHLIF